MIKENLDAKKREMRKIFPQFFSIEGYEDVNCNEVAMVLEKIGLQIFSEKKKGCNRCSFMDYLSGKKGAYQSMHKDKETIIKYATEHIDLVKTLLTQKRDEQRRTQERLSRLRTAQTIARRNSQAANA